jgi:hypothetical protein
MNELLDESLVQQRFRTWLVSGFAALALLLSAIGIYALISYSVSQRTREIGVRIALGAQRSNVLGLVLREGLQVVAFGLLLGLVGALSATRIMRSLLYSTSATDALSFIATSFTLIAVGSASVLYSSSPRHESGPDGRSAIRVGLGAYGGGEPPPNRFRAYSRTTGSYAASTVD